MDALVPNISLKDKANIEKGLKKVSLFETTKKTILDILNNQKGIDISRKNEGALSFQISLVVSFYKERGIKILVKKSKKGGKFMAHLKIDTNIEEKKLKSNGKTHELKEKKESQFKILESLFIENINKIVTFDKIKELGIKDSSIGALISRFKKSKVGNGLSLVNVRGHGYIYGTQEEINKVLSQISNKGEPNKKEINFEKLGKTSLYRLGNFLEEKRGYLVGFDEIKKQIGITHLSAKGLIVELQRLLSQIGNGLLLQNVRGQGYIYGTEEEIRKVREELFPTKVKEKKVKKEEIKPEKKYRLTVLDKLSEFFESNKGELLSLEQISERTGIPLSTIKPSLGEIQRALEGVGRASNFENIRGKGYVYGTEEEIRKVREELFPTRIKERKIKMEKVLKEKKTRKGRMKGSIEVAGGEKGGGNIGEREQRHDLERLGRGKGGIVRDLKLGLNDGSDLKQVLEGFNKIKGTFQLYSKEIVQEFEVDTENHKFAGIQLENDEFCFLILLYNLKEVSIINVKNFLQVSHIDDKTLEQYLILLKAGLLNKFGKFINIDKSKNGYRLTILTGKVKKSNDKGSLKRKTKTKLKSKAVLSRKPLEILSFIELQEEYKVNLDKVLSKFSITLPTLRSYASEINEALRQKNVNYRFSIVGQDVFLKKAVGDASLKKGHKEDSGNPDTSEISRGSDSFGESKDNGLNIGGKKLGTIIVDNVPLGDIIYDFGMTDSSINTLSDKHDDVNINVKEWKINGIQFTQQEFFFYCYVLSKRGKEIAIKDIETINDTMKGITLYSLLLLKSSINAKVGNNSPYAIQINDKKFRIPLLEKDAKEEFTVLEWKIEVYKKQKILVFISEQNGKRKEITSFGDDVFQFFYKLLSTEQNTIAFNSQHNSTIVDAINSVFFNNGILLSLKKNTSQRTIRIGRYGDDSDEFIGRTKENMRQSIVSKKEALFINLQKKLHEGKSDFEFNKDTNTIEYIENGSGNIYEISDLTDDEFLLFMIFAASFETHTSLLKISAYLEQEVNSNFSQLVSEYTARINIFLKEKGISLEIKKKSKDDYILQKLEGKTEKFDSVYGKFELLSSPNKAGGSLIYNGTLCETSNSLFEYIGRLLRRIKEGELRIQTKDGDPWEHIKAIREELTKYQLPFALESSGKRKTPGLRFFFKKK